MMDTLDDKTLIRKTLVTVAAMLGALVLVVGSLSLVALLIVGRATEPSSAAKEDVAPLRPATTAPVPMNGLAPAQDPASRGGVPRNVAKPNQI
jgi:hypothetical protein